MLSPVPAFVTAEGEMVSQSLFNLQGSPVALAGLDCVVLHLPHAWAGHMDMIAATCATPPQEAVAQEGDQAVTTEQQA